MIDNEADKILNDMVTSVVFFKLHTLSYSQALRILTGKTVEPDLRNVNFDQADDSFFSYAVRSNFLALVRSNKLNCH
jgi:hypothetical protein